MSSMDSENLRDVKPFRKQMIEEFKVLLQKS